MSEQSLKFIQSVRSLWNELEQLNSVPKFFDYEEQGYAVIGLTGFYADNGKQHRTINAMSRVQKAAVGKTPGILSELQKQIPLIPERGYIEIQYNQGNMFIVRESDVLLFTNQMEVFQNARSVPDAFNKATFEGNAPYIFEAMVNSQYRALSLGLGDGQVVILSYFQEYLTGGKTNGITGDSEITVEGDTFSDYQKLSGIFLRLKPNEYATFTVKGVEGRFIAIKEEPVVTPQASIKAETPVVPQQPAGTSAADISQSTEPPNTQDSATLKEGDMTDTQSEDLSETEPEPEKIARLPFVNLEELANGGHEQIFSKVNETGAITAIRDQTGRCKVVMLPLSKAEDLKAQGLILSTVTLENFLEAPEIFANQIFEDQRNGRVFVVCDQAQKKYVIVGTGAAEESIAQSLLNDNKEAQLIYEDKPRSPVITSASREITVRVRQNLRQNPVESFGDLPPNGVTILINSQNNPVPFVTIVSPDIANIIQNKLGDEVCSMGSVTNLRENYGEDFYSAVQNGGKLVIIEKYPSTFAADQTPTVLGGVLPVKTGNPDIHSIVYGDASLDPEAFAQQWMADAKPVVVLRKIPKKFLSPDAVSVNKLIQGLDQYHRQINAGNTGVTLKHQSQIKGIILPLRYQNCLEHFDIETIGMSYLKRNAPVFFKRLKENSVTLIAYNDAPQFLIVSHQPTPDIIQALHDAKNIFDVETPAVTMPEQPAEKPEKPMAPKVAVPKIEAPAKLPGDISSINLNLGEGTALNIGEGKLANRLKLLQAAADLRNAVAALRETLRNNQKIKKHADGHVYVTSHQELASLVEAFSSVLKIPHERIEISNDNSAPQQWHNAFNQAANLDAGFVTVSDATLGFDVVVFPNNERMRIEILPAIAPELNLE